MKTYNHWRDFPMSQWRWPSFKPSELRSKSDNKLGIDEDAMDKLQRLRDLLGRPMYITSAYRSPAHNRRVGGAKNSYHMQARAFDVRMRNQDTQEFVKYARQVGFTGFGYYPKSGFIHIDTGPARSWGTFWKQDNRSGPKQPPVKPAVPEADTPSWLSVLISVIRKLFRR